MESTAEIAGGVVIEAFLAAIALGVVYRLWGRILPVPTRQTVLTFQRGVQLKGGEFEKILNPGTYWMMSSRTLLICDMRPKPFQVAAQEMITANGMGVRISLSGEYRITDPARFVTESSALFDTFYLELRQALRAAVGELSDDAILNGNTPVTSRIEELLVPRAAQLGIEMNQLDIWEAVPLGWVRHG